MKTKVFLSGGGDSAQTFNVDSVFLKKVKNVLYIPLAWENDDFDSCYNWLSNSLALHKRVKIDMLTNLDKRVNLKDHDAVYIGGGNTFKLLKRIKESNFDKVLLDYYAHGGTIYGGSAGAIIWGRSILTAALGDNPDKNEVKLKDTLGLNILNGADIQCHYKSFQLKIHKDYSKKTKRKVVAIPEESALFIDGTILRVLGNKPIFLISESKVIRCDPGQEIKI